MKGEKSSSWLLAALIVLVAVSIYNVNTVMQGFNESYFKGLLVVTLVSIVLSSVLVGLLGKPKKAKVA